MKKFILFAASSLFAIVSMAQSLQAPVLSHPDSADDAVDVNVRIAWNPSLGGTVTHYEAQLSTNPSFTSLIPFPIWGTSMVTGELDFNQQYYWRVRGINSATSTVSPWSNVWSFTTFHDQFNLTGPNNIVNPNATLKWDSIAGTEFYVYQYSEDSLFTVYSSDTISHPPLPEDLKTIKPQLSDLNFGATYYWRVKSVHSKDESVWSYVRTFDVISSVALQSPGDSATEITPETRLRCNSDIREGIDSYRFAVSDVSNFDPSSPNTKIYVAHAKDFPVWVDYTVNPPEDRYPKIDVYTEYLNFGTTYYWRIQGIHSKSVSAWSETRTFTTIDEPILQKPNHEAIGDELKEVEFHWKMIDGAEQYEFEIDTTMNFTSHHRVVALGDTVDSVIFDLEEYDKWYYWRVKASHAFDESKWSEVRKYMVGSFTGTEELKNSFDFTLYPNPAENVVYIDLKAQNGGEATLELYTVLGEKVDKINVGKISNSERIEYGLENIDPGVYLLVLELNGDRSIQRFTVK